MKKNWTLMGATIVLGAMLAACGTDSNAAQGDQNDSASEAGEQPEEVVVTHELGETTVPVNPENVVVFDFGALDTLDELGVDVAGVAQTNVPSYLSKYEDSKYENVGSLKEPDFEKISEMAPGLIVISGRQSDAYDELSEIAPTIYVGVDNADYVNSFEENTRILGEIFDKEDEVEQKIEEVHAKIDKVADHVEENGTEGLIVLVNDGSLSAYGPSSRFGLIHDVLGVKPVDEDIEVNTHGQSVSFEYVAEKNPDYLFVVDRGAAVSGGDSSATQVLDNELINNTDAAKEDHIVMLNPDYWYLSGGGLQSTAEMVQEIDDVLE